MLKGRNPITGAFEEVAVTSDGRLLVTAEGETTSSYKISDLDTGGTTQYFGYVDANGNWYILQLTGTTARYAKGTAASAWPAVWAARASLSYDYFYEVF